MDETTKRNFLAVQQAVNSFEERLQELQIVINQIKESLSSLSTTVGNLQQSNNVLQARHLIFGNGPTVRE